MNQEQEVVRDYLEKMEPLILSDDKIVLDQALHNLRQYPYVPVEWLNQLLDRAFHEPEFRDNILIYTDHFPINEESVPLLMKLDDGLPLIRKHLLRSYFLKMNPELIVGFEGELLKKDLVTKDFMKICKFLSNGSKDELLKELAEVVEALEEERYINQSLYSLAKKVVKKLVDNGWYGKDEIKEIMEKELQNDWFTYSGVLAVYAIGLLQLEEYIPVLAELLERDDDLLLEETSAALSVFQSDEVVKAVLPYAKQEASYIFAVGVLEDTKTESSTAALVECYSALADGEAKSLCVKAICSHLSEKAIPLIDDFIQQEYFTGMFNPDPVYYGYFKMMGIDDPRLEQWKKSIHEREERQKQRRAETFVSSQKVGRNDPCPCGSGKKYKKCCGA